MKKILSLLAVAAISTPTAGLTSGWTENHNQTLKVSNANLKFDASNLSTWGKTQTNIISQSVYVSTIGFPANGTWSQWVNGAFQDYKEINALSNAFHKINPNIHFDLSDGTVNVKRVYSPAPNPNQTLEQALDHGVQLNVQGFNDIKGFLSFKLTSDY